jgi:Domain of unknown function (DUF4082)/Bacterial Ig domain/Cadherin-like domain
MSDWTVISQSGIVPQRSEGENYIDVSETFWEAGRFVDLGGAPARRVSEPAFRQWKGVNRIKSEKQRDATSRSVVDTTDRPVRGSRPRGKNAATVELDPLALGLMTALAASLATASPVAAAPSHVPDAGVPSEQPDGQVPVDDTPKGDNPVQYLRDDDPSITGSVQRDDRQGQPLPEASRHPVGSSTPPDVWHSGEAPLDKWGPAPITQRDTPLSSTVVGFNEEHSSAFDPFGSFGFSLAGRVSSETANGSTATLIVTAPATDTTTVIAPPSAAPVARNDGDYLVVGGRRIIQVTTLLANDMASPGLHLTVGDVFDPQHGIVTYDATSQAVTFTATAGYRGNASFAYTVEDDKGRSAQATVSLFVVPDETLFGTVTLPATDSVNDNNPVELGVRFASASDGVITGLRFYKGADNTGLHTADLWDSNGNLLATATFSAETGNGWQQVSFSAPVTIQAGVIYVASYHTNGFYSADAGYFASPVTNGDLTGIGSVYAYGTGSTFPTNSYNANNYWVDVVYNKPPAAPDPQDDVLGAISSAHAASFGSSLLLANDQNPDGIPFNVTGASNALHGTVSFDPLTQAVTFTPTQGYSGTAGFSYTVTNDLGVSATANAKLWIDGAQPASFYDATAVPAIVNAHDNQSVELGFKFESATDGQVLGLRFYKGADNTGTHVGNLWSATGDLLASATFTNETADGWQSVLFSAPVSLAAGATYVASYHSDGNYSADPGYFASAHTDGVLVAPASTAGSGNGLYAYGSSSLFPTNSFNATGYGVDVLFKANLTG